MCIILAAFKHMSAAGKACQQLVKHVSSCGSAERAVEERAVGVLLRRERVWRDLIQIPACPRIGIQVAGKE